MSQQEALMTRPEREWLPTLKAAATLWAETTTEIRSQRREDLHRDKRRAVEDFFRFAGKRPVEIETSDVQAWLSHLKKLKLSANTIHTRISHLSSFFGWAIKNSADGDSLRVNPVALARPKRPRSYQTEATKALDDDEVRALLRVVRSKAKDGNLVAKRDLALPLWYLLSGMRRAEVIGLRGKDIDLKENAIIVRGRVKGGTYAGREISDAELRSAVIDYLTAAKRLHALKIDAALWTRHDRGGKPGDALSSHAFVRNLKRYAAEAGIAHIHLHQTRHTYARIVSEETGSLIDTQDALGHESPTTTRIYVQRIAIKRDKYSGRVSARLRE